MTFGERIRALADKLGKDEQEVAADLGISKAQMSHYVNGRRKVPSELLQKIVDVYGINPQYLFKNDATLYFNEEKALVINEPSTHYNYIPHPISAGLPETVDGTDHLPSISIPDSIMGKYAGHSDIQMMRVNGESMNRVIPNGSLIAVKKMPIEHIKDGDIVVYRDSYEYAVKRIYRTDGKLIFRPDSHDPSFTDYVADIDEQLDIIGKVVIYIVELD